MSRIGKKAVAIPPGVEVKIDNQVVTVKGKNGLLTRTFHPEVVLQQGATEVVVTLRNEGSSAYRPLWGLSRTLLANMVTGVSTGFSKQLMILGVGYRAAVEGRILKLALGFSHPVDFPIPDGIQIEVEKNTALTVRGADREMVGQVCAKIRDYRSPEPYKGKGVRYLNEYVVMKEGKKSKKKK
ncbi:MAG: 50S ribosomal protein L6 [Magnetococcales bacterium]|nr:50S ribosomal protein L6 [Magnetococcales bacterium]